MNHIKDRLNSLREELNALIDNIDNCSKEQLLEVSRELDEVIYEYMKAESTL